MDSAWTWAMLDFLPLLSFDLDDDLDDDVFDDDDFDEDVFDFFILLDDLLLLFCDIEDNRLVGEDGLGVFGVFGFMMHSIPGVFQKPKSSYLRRIVHLRANFRTVTFENVFTKFLNLFCL